MARSRAGNCGEPVMARSNPGRSQSGEQRIAALRTHPDSGPGVPKYLNTPETSAYKKGNLLFGLHQARDRLARGAMPVITEGPFDAIAVTLAGRDRYAGLAPRGPALTSAQIEALSRIADLRQAGILVAFDGDTAGRKAAVRAYDLLRATSDRLQAAALPGKDPAEILESYGAAALCTALRDRVSAAIRPCHRRSPRTVGPVGCEIPGERCWPCAAWPQSSPASCQQRPPRQSGASPETRNWRR